MKYYILALVSALFLSGCGLIEDSLPDCQDPNAAEKITLSFKMISSRIGSRADAGNHDEVDSEWHQFEDLIDINNFAFYIFLENGANRPLVMKMTNIDGSTDPNQMITGAYGAYTVTTVIPKQNLENLLGRELDPGSANPVNFRVVLLANASAGTDYDALAEVDGQPATYAQFMDNAAQLRVNLNDNGFYNPLDSDSSVDGIYKGAVPMFGTLVFSTTEEALYSSRPEERIYMGDIYMLRSLAKVRVIDAAPKDEDGYPKIISVTVNGSTDMSALLPANASSYVNGNQVHAINYVAPSAATANKIFRLGYLNDNAVRFGYIPEQTIQAADPSTPVIVITAQLDAERTQAYIVPMGGSAEYNTVNFGTSILRNHIYTLQVNHIAVGTPAEIEVDVRQWEESEFNLDYTESVTVPNKLNWNPATYLGNENGVVVVKPWTTTEDGATWSPLVGTFGIQTPVGAKWTAYLLTVSGAEDAFRFLDYSQPDEASGTSFTMVSSVDGIVDGKMSSLTIVTTDPDPAQQNRARLQVVVTIGEGSAATVIEADITPENTSYKNYTIVQNPL